MRIRFFLPYLLFLLVAMMLLKDPLFLGRSFAIHSLYRSYPWKGEQKEASQIVDNNAGSDGTLTFYPRRFFSYEMFQKGELPLWNPYLLGGMPFQADSHSAVFYPPNVLYAFFPPEKVLPWLALLSLTLAGCFAFALFKDLGFHPLASAFGGIVFELNPFLMTHLVNPTNVDSGIWLPAILLCFRKAMHTKTKRIQIFWIWLLGIGEAMSILGGFPQIMVFSTYALLFYAFLCSLRQFYGEKRVLYALRPLFLAVSGILIGALLASVQLLPLWELSLESARRTIDLSAFKAIFIPIETLLMYIIPDIFGEPNQSFFGAFVQALKHSAYPSEVWRNSFLENAAYPGILSLLFSPFALRGHFRKLDVIYFLLLALLSLMLTLGTPLFTLCYHLLPGFKFSRICRIVYLFGFGMAGLSASGLDVILGPGYRRSRWISLLVAVTMALTVWVGTVYFADRTHFLRLNEALQPYIQGQEQWSVFFEKTGQNYAVFLDALKRFALYLSLGALIIFWAGRRFFPRNLAGITAIGLLLCDLLFFLGALFYVSRRFLSKNTFVHHPIFTISGWTFSDCPLWRNARDFAAKYASSVWHFRSGRIKRTFNGSIWKTGRADLARGLYRQQKNHRF